MKRLPTLTLDVGTSALADALALFKIGLIDTRPSGLKSYTGQNRAFHRSALSGLKDWPLRFGLPRVWPLGSTQSPTFLEVVPSATYCGDSNSPTLGADRRSQDPLFDLQMHPSHNLDPKFRASVDLQYRIGGETTTDGVDDDNRQGVLGGGVSAGYAFSPKLAVQATPGKVLFEDDGSKEDMIRVKLAYTFL
jgi:hypothetical protein